MKTDANCIFCKPARSMVGAGDSVLAGAVVGLWRGMPPRDAVRWQTDGRNQVVG